MPGEGPERLPCAGAVGSGLDCAFPERVGVRVACRRGAGGVPGGAGIGAAARRQWRGALRGWGSHAAPPSPGRLRGPVSEAAVLGLWLPPARGLAQAAGLRVGAARRWRARDGRQPAGALPQRSRIREEPSGLKAKTGVCKRVSADRSRLQSAAAFPAAKGSQRAPCPPQRSCRSGVQREQSSAQREG